MKIKKTQISIMGKLTYLNGSLKRDPNTYGLKWASDLPNRYQRLIIIILLGSGGSIVQG